MYVYFHCQNCYGSTIGHVPQGTTTGWSLLDGGKYQQGWHHQSNTSEHACWMMTNVCITVVIFIVKILGYDMTKTYFLHHNWIKLRYYRNTSIDRKGIHWTKRCTIIPASYKHFVCRVFVSTVRCCVVWYDKKTSQNDTLSPHLKMT